MMPESISCPVSHVLINENRVRITASLVFLAGVSCFILPNWAVPGFLTIDFFLRGFGKGGYSPLNLLSGWIVRKFSVKNKPIDQAPKLFAAQLGFAICVLLLAASIFSLTAAAYSIAAVLVLFSFLESALAFCAGCYVYSFLFRRR